MPCSIDIHHLQTQRNKAVQALSDYKLAIAEEVKAQQEENERKDAAATQQFNEVWGQHAQEIDKNGLCTMA